MISEYYRNQNEELHRSNESYGTSGKKFAPMVRSLCEQYETTDVLDYGCGKATLAQALGPHIKNYDPAIPQYSARPLPADFVVCTDVMEHIEKEYLKEVLDDIVSLTEKIALISIASRPALKVLPDGRNTHLIQENYQWWMPWLWDRFSIILFENMHDKEYIFLLGRLDDYRPY